MRLDTLFFWNYKQPSENDWRPQIGADPVKYLDRLPTAIKRTDLQASVVDVREQWWDCDLDSTSANSIALQVAPFICGAGGLAHMSQLNNLGWTVPASIFRNKATMTAMHRTGLFLTPLLLVLQAAGIGYRQYIPRWSHDRERRRDEEEVRKHVDVGMGMGAVAWALRMYAFNLGRAYWFPVDVVMGGALADLLHREYCKAHGF